MELVLQKNKQAKTRVDLNGNRVWSCHPVEFEPWMSWLQVDTFTTDSNLIRPRNFMEPKFEHYYLFSVSLLQSFVNPNKTILGTIFPKPQAFIIEVAPCSKSWLGTALKKALMWWSFNHKLTLDRRASKYPYPWVPSFTCAQINSDNFLVIKLAKSTSGWRCAGTPLKIQNKSLVKKPEKSLVKLKKKNLCQYLRWKITRETLLYINETSRVKYFIP